MKLLKIFLIITLIGLLTGCGNNSVLDRPEYKPKDRKNEAVKKLWANGEKFYVTSIINAFGNIELSFGNNGTISPDSYLSPNNKIGYGFAFALEVTNKGDRDYLINLDNTFIRDTNGKIWQIYKCEKVLDNQRTDSSVNLKPMENYSNNSDIFSNNLIKTYAKGSTVRVKPKKTTNLFMFFCSDYLTIEELPNDLTFNIETQMEGQTYSNKYKFDRIIW